MDAARRSIPCRHCPAHHDWRASRACPLPGYFGNKAGLTAATLAYATGATLYYASLPQYGQLCGLRQLLSVALTSQDSSCCCLPSRTSTSSE